MRAAQLTGERTIRIAEVPAPEEPGEGEVLVSVQAVGICGSDVHNYLEGGIGERKVVYPFIPGHEASGRIVKTGSGVTGLQAGDRVMIEPALHCGHCDQCRAGRFHTCRHIQFLSSAGELQGCMCEQIVIPAQNALLVDGNVLDEEIALAEPLSVAIHSVRNSMALDRDTPIAILGAGPIGLCTLLAARHRGASRIYVTDPIEVRRNAARSIGAFWAGAPDELSTQEPLGMAAVFECSGKPEALDQAIDLLCPGGKLIVTGIPEGNRVSLNISQLRRKELSIFHVRRQNRCAEEAVELIVSGAVDVKPLLTHRFALEAAGEAFDLVAGYGDGVIKAVVRCSAAG